MKLDPRINNENYIILILIENDKIIFYNDYRDIKAPLHNLNGPAIICTNGNLEYWIDGQLIGDNLSNKEFEQKVKKYIFK